MTEMINGMGLNVEEAGEKMYRVTGDNTKLMELKVVLDNIGYTNDNSGMNALFGLPIPQNEEVTEIIINNYAGTGYLLLA